MNRGQSGVRAFGATILALVVVAAASSAASAAAPPDTPDLAQMALGVSDLPAGAKVRRQGYVKDSDFVAAYQREFKSGVRIGRSRVDLLESDVALAQTAEEAASYYAGVAAVLKTKKGRALLAKQLLADLPKDVPKGAFKLTFGKVSSLRVGENSLIAPITFDFLGIVRVPIVLAFVRTDKVIMALDIGGFVNGKIAASDVARLAKAVASHVEVGLVPANSSPPTINGTAQSGATLAVANGQWTKNPSSYAYRWLRCDASGANCQPIADAAAQTYVVTDADIASTLRAEVTAVNGPARSQPLQSGQTQVVTPAGPGPPPPPGTAAQVERIMVCPASDVSVTTGGPTICNKDWSARGIAAGGRIYCTVEITAGTGANASVAFVSGTSTVYQGSSTAITAADWLQWIWFGPFTSGTYACTVTLNGSLVAQLPFVVGA
jgi:hypothetical protein